MTDAAARANFGDDSKDDVFGGDAWCKRSFNSDAHPLWTRLRKRLRCKNVFHFAGTNSESKRAECTMGCSVAIAAHDGHAWKRATLFWSNDVHDALLGMTHWVQRDTKLFCVCAQHFNLL